MTDERYTTTQKKRLKLYKSVDEENK